MLEIDGVVAVEVGAVGNAISVLRPQSADIVRGIESERIRVLT